MPDHDLSAQLRAYVDAVAEPVQAEEAVTGRDIEREVLEAVAVRAPDDRADDLEQRRDNNKDRDLPSHGRRL